MNLPPARHGTNHTLPTVETHSAPEGEFSTYGYQRDILRQHRSHLLAPFLTHNGCTQGIQEEKFSNKGQKGWVATWEDISASDTCPPEADAAFVAVLLGLPLFSQQSPFPKEEFNKKLWVGSLRVFSLYTRGKAT